MKRLTICALLAIGIFLMAPTAAAQDTFPMPYCTCIDMDSTPLGPDFPQGFESETVHGFYKYIEGHMTTFCKDIGNLPYSVPGYGWYCGHTPIYLTAEIIGFDHSMQLRIDPINCCGGEYSPPDVVFKSGVALPFDPIMNAYFATYGNNSYLVEFDSENHFRVLLATTGPNTGGISTYSEIEFQILPAPPSVEFEAPNRMEVE